MYFSKPVFSYINLFKRDIISARSKSLSARACRPACRLDIKRAAPAPFPDTSAITIPYLCLLN